jgi:hypothetical protein
MKLAEILDEQTGAEARLYLNLLYVSGWEQGKKYLGGHKKRKVELHNKEKVTTFDSIVEAVKEIKDSESSIKRSLRTGQGTKKGHVWKYKL